MISKDLTIDVIIPKIYREYLQLYTPLEIYNMIIFKARKCLVEVDSIKGDN